MSAAYNVMSPDPSGNYASRFDCPLWSAATVSSSQAAASSPGSSQSRILSSLPGIRGIDVKKPPFYKKPPLFVPKKFSVAGRKFFGDLNVLKSSKIMFFADFLMIIFGI